MLILLTADIRARILYHFEHWSALMKTTFGQFTSFMTNLKKTLQKYAPDLEPSTVALWFDALNQIEVEELRYIYKHCIDNLDAFPSIKQIRELSQRNVDDGLPKDPLRALIESASRNPSDIHPCVNDLAERLGGWRVIGQWPIDSYDYKRKHVNEMWEKIRYEISIGTKPTVIDRIQFAQSKIPERNGDIAATLLLEVANAEKGIQQIPVFEDPMNRTDEGMNQISQELAAIRSSIRTYSKKPSMCN